VYCACASDSRARETSTRAFTLPRFSAGHEMIGPTA